MQFMPGNLWKPYLCQNKQRKHYSKAKGRGQLCRHSERYEEKYRRRKITSTNKQYQQNNRRVLGNTVYPTERGEQNDITGRSRKKYERPCKCQNRKED